jgi:hypothetical protein
MSNERLEKLMNFSLAIALISGMIIRGKIGFIGFVIFASITMIIGIVFIKRGIDRKPDILEIIYVAGVLVLALIVGYLVEYKKSYDFGVVMLLLVVSAIWFLGGAIFLAIRKERRGKL